MEVRSAIQQIALEHRRRYGYRRVRRSCTAGDASEPQEVARIMREDNLLDAAGAVRGHHQFESQAEIYLNLAHRINDGHQSLWVADITYIRLKADLSIT